MNPSPPFTTRMSLWSARHRWLTVGAALAIVLFAGVISGTVETKLLDSNGAEGEAARAADLIDASFTGNEDEAPEQLIVAHPELTVDDPAFRATAESVIADVASLEARFEGPGGLIERPLTAVESYYDTGNPALVSEDRHVLRVPVTLLGQVSPVIDAVDEAASEAEGFTISIAGPTSIEFQDEEIMDEDFAMVLFASLGAGLIILLIAFRSVVAATIPLAMALGAIFVTMSIAALVSQIYELHELYAEMVLLMGLAVGIDYSLFMVARFRRERAAGREKYEAIGVASSTTGRAVFFAGITVMLSIAGLIMTSNPIFISLSLGAIIVVAVAVLASLTLLPALIAVVGDGVNRFKLPLPGGSGEDGRLWGWVTDRVLRSPAIYAGITTAAIVALAVPIVTLSLGFSTGSAAYPDAVTGKAALELIEEHFSGGITQPAEIVIEGSGPEVDAAVAALAQRLDSEPDFGGPVTSHTSPDGAITLVSAPIAYETDDSRSEDAVRHLRSTVLPEVFDGTGLSVGVTGQTAGSMDFTDHMLGRAPYVFGFVLGLAFLLLMVMFRSVIIPVKAVVLNLLSVAAAYGVLVLVFQEGVASGLLGFEPTGRIAPWLPLFLFAILFGLSMDYHMLLLGRIKENYDRGMSNEQSVAEGIRATAGTITSAAAIMVAVFATFALARDIELKQFGVGLGVAVFLDATIIRVILLPASMKLLGDTNWYLPPWLSWLPHAGTEGGEPGPALKLEAARAGE